MIMWMCVVRVRSCWACDQSLDEGTGSSLWCSVTCRAHAQDYNPWKGVRARQTAYNLGFTEKTEFVFGMLQKHLRLSQASGQER